MLTFNLDDLRKVTQESSLSEGRRISREDVLEVDAKISFEREQETLIKEANANPWFTYDQGITRLKWPAKPTSSLITEMAG